MGTTALSTEAWVSVGRIFCRSKGFHLKKKINMIRLMVLAVLVTMAVAGPYYLYPGYSHPQVAIAPSLTYAYVPGALGNVGTYSVVNVVKRFVELVRIGFLCFFLRMKGVQILRPTL